MTAHPVPPLVPPGSGQASPAVEISAERSATPHQSTTPAQDDLGIHAPVGLVITDGDSKIIDCNNRYSELVGIPAAEMRGGYLSRRFTGASRIYWESRLLPELLSGKRVSGVTVSVLVGESGTAERTLFIGAVPEPAPELAQGVRLRFAFLEAEERQNYERAMLDARREAEAAATRLQVLQRAITGSAGALTHEALGQSLTSAAIEATDAGRASFALLQEDGTLRVVAGTHPLFSPQGEAEAKQAEEGTDEERAEQHAGSLAAPLTPEETALRSQSPEVLLNRAAIIQRYPEYSEQFRKARVEAIVSAPVIHEGTSLGVLTCWFGRSRTEDESAVELVGALAAGAVPVLQRLELLRSLEHRATHDTLTGLPNRAMAEGRLAAMLRELRPQEADLGVVFVDLDGFKSLNDTAGHEAGDRALRLTAERLEGSIRRGDTVARLGGDEFLMLCRGVSAEALEAVTERARAALAELGELPGTLGLSASLGAVHVPGGAALAPSAAALIAQADESMYRSKALGKNRVTITSWEPSAEVPPGA